MHPDAPALMDFAKACNDNFNSRDAFNARQYLKARGIDYSRFQKDPNFRIGYCSYATTTGNFQKKYGFTVDDMIKMGLRTGKYGMESFGGMITFPVFAKNKCVYLTSRAAGDNVKIRHKHLRKRIYYPYNIDSIFHSSSNVPKEKLYIVEGTMDCLSMVQMGMPMTIATYGTSGLKDQALPFLPDLSTIIYLVYDNDENGSGIKGANKVAWKLTRWGYSNVFVVTLRRPNGVKKVDCNNILINGAKTPRNFWGYVDHYTRYTSTNDYEKRLRWAYKDKIRRAKNMYQEADSILDNAIQDIPLPDVIEKLTGKKASIGDHIICPFPDHEDANPSMMLYRQNTFYCFGCQRGGGPLQFAMAYWKVSREEAKKRLLQIMNGN
jgi:DNA primase